MITILGDIMVENKNIQSLNNLIDGLTVLQENETFFENASTKELSEFMDSLQTLNDLIDNVIDEQQNIDLNKMDSLINEIDIYFNNNITEAREIVQMVSEIGKPIDINKLQ